jgi:phosphoenolpyruvate carboxykinase (ATP)
LPVGSPSLLPWTRLTIIRLKYTRAILDAIHSGELAKVEFETYETFNLAVPKSCTGVPSELLNPRNAWSQGEDSFRAEVTKLGRLFVENFKKYQSEATEEVIAAGPKIDVDVVVGVPVENVK